MKKGFTLIELLAVIVILAIIALIAAPIVLNIINDSKESSLERSAENYIRAVEFAIANNQVKNKTKNMDGVYTISDEGKTITRNLSTIISVDYDGIGIRQGQIILEGGKVTELKKAMIDKYYVSIQSNKIVLSETGISSTLDTGTNLNQKMKELSKLGDDTENPIRNIKHSNSLKEGLGSTNIVSIDNLEYPVYMWYEETDNTIYYYSEADVIYLNQDSSRMFERFFDIENVDGLDGFDTSKVTNMSRMFNGASALNDITALKSWNVKNVTNMSKMFNGANSLSDITALKNWNVGNVTDMNSLFSYSGINTLTALKDWDVKSVINMSWMFGGTNISGLTELKDWTTSNVENMSSMFNSCSSLVKLDGLGTWNVKKVTNMASMFQGCESLTDVMSINDWDIGKSTDFQFMFYYVSTHPEFTKVIGTWDSNGTFMPNN